MSAIRATAAVLGALALAGCGSALHLKPAPGESLPVAARGAKKPRTPDQLLAPGVQTRPQRSDDLLVTSEARRSDEFALPPGNVAGTPSAAPVKAPNPAARPTTGDTTDTSR